MASAKLWETGTLHFCLSRTDGEGALSLGRERDEITGLGYARRKGRCVFWMPPS